jgi:hypothetical protein
MSTVSIRADGRLVGDGFVLVQFADALDGVSGSAGGERGVPGELEFGRVVEIPVFFRNGERQVGAGEAGGDEERPGSVLGGAQALDRFGGDAAVAPRAQTATRENNLHRFTLIFSSSPWLERRNR